MIETTPGEGELRGAIIFGSVLASFTVEQFSLDRLREISLRDVHERYADFRALTLVWSAATGVAAFV